MILKTRGIAHNIFEPIVASVTRNLLSNDSNQVLIIEDSFVINYPNQFKAIITNFEIDTKLINYPIVHSVKTIDHLKEGDILVINTDGVINTLYRVNSFQNFLLVTEQCNSNCLMCSQPPKDREDIPYLFNIQKQLIPLIPKDCLELGITGGEPTLMGNLFFELLELIKSHLPNTEIHCLTNGRLFKSYNFTKQLGDLIYDKLMLGIPVYSDFYQVHDFIVQANGAFNETILGLYNLAFFNQRIEIRVVLHRQSIPRLVKLAKYIYKNLPFVEHIAFMGLENQGYTPYNIEKLWIDPIDYMEDLCEAVEYLSSKDLNVSIYNSQLCVMPEKLWEYNKKSISDWKTIYLDECSNCSLIDMCGGLFASSENMHSKHIHRIERLP